MPTIHVENTGQRIETDLVSSLLRALQRNQVPIETVCGGRARCGRCAVHVLAGSRNLSRKSVAESTRLEAIGAEQDVRLACQTYTRGDISIRIVNLKSS
jgi:adenylate cyclase